MSSLPWWMKIVVEEEQENRKGPWTLEEDNKLISYIRVHGAARWSSLAKLAGLKRDGKSCRMRWLNYLRPELKHGSFSPEEDQLIIELQKKWGNKWSCIAQNLPGRTDNEIKNHWRTHIMKMSPKCLSTSKSSQETMGEGEINKAASSKGSEYSQMATREESFNESDSDNTINKVNCDNWDSNCGSQELVEQSCYMDMTVNNIIAGAYAAGIVQQSPSSSWSCGTDCAMNILSDSQDFIWDYNSIDLWNLNDPESIYQ